VTLLTHDFYHAGFYYSWVLHACLLFFGPFSSFLHPFSPLSHLVKSIKAQRREDGKTKDGKEDCTLMPGTMSLMDRVKEYEWRSMGEKYVLGLDQNTASLVT
jgi:hypothetical protein